MLNGIDLETAIDQLAHVEIVRYPLGQTPPQGRVAQVLGSDAETASDIDIVYCKHDLPRRFSDAALAAAAELPPRIRKTDLKGRLDLRQSLTLAIAGPQPQMVDDALTLEKDSADRWRLGIHIVDIAQYVTAHGAIDHEAAKRGSAVYLGSEVVPLLPPGLTDNLGSLSVGKDRLVLSVLVTLDDRGQVLEYEVQPAVINLDHQITYGEAHAILERDNHEVLESLGIAAKTLETWEPIFDLVDNLLYLSQAIKRQRLQRGSFELNLPEYDFPVDAQEPLAHYRSPKFQYDDEGLLGVMVVSSGGLARAIVTECMLLANQLVAQHLKALGVPALYRVHRAPDLTEAQELIKLVENMGLSLNLSNPEVVQPVDYQAFAQQFASSDQEKILTYLLLETIQPAFYAIHPALHFGLALEEGYTHFTSPSRRYADLVIQRILHAIFDAGRDRRTTRSKEVVNLRHSSCHGQVGWNVLPPEIQHELEDDLGRMAIHLTERERLAQEAESDLEGLKKAEFMRSHTGEVFHGLITGVQSYGFFVEIEDLLVEGLVHVSSLKDDWYEYRARQQKLVGRKNRQQYCLGDQVDVQVKSVDYYRQQIDLVAVGGGSQLPEEEAEVNGDSEYGEAPLPDLAGADGDPDALAAMVMDEDE
jgi:ribonuclease R